MLYYVSYKSMNRSSVIGFILFILFIFQLLTGLLLSIYYIDFAADAFSSVCRIIIDSNSGWLVRTFHIVGASIYIIFLLLHFIRGYYRIVGINSGSSRSSYLTGLILLLISLITAFLGYILNWGQMSFWGMTVIISIINTLWVIGDYIRSIIWPSFTLGISRLFTVHFLLGLLTILIILYHLILLHAYSSSNPLINNYSIPLPFYCYFFKDLLYLCYLLFIISLLLLFDPDLLGNSDNNIPANPFTTPHNILPEWYFLLFYATLRSYPNKIIGVIIILLLFILLIIN